MIREVQNVKVWPANCYFYLISDTIRISRSKFSVDGHPYARPQRHRDASATKKLDILRIG
jgi:hypothetical protein